MQGEPVKHPEEPSWQLSSGRSKNYSHTYMIAHYRLSAGPGSYSLENTARPRSGGFFYWTKCIIFYLHTLNCTYDTQRKGASERQHYFCKFSQGVYVGQHVPESAAALQL